MHDGILPARHAAGPAAGGLDFRGGALRRVGGRLRRVWVLAAVVPLAAGFAAAGRELHVTVVSGSPQSAHAFVASGKRAYVTEFGAPLVVRVDPAPPDARKLHVRFRCATTPCTLVPTDQPNGGDGIERVPDQPAYDVEVVKGRAAVRVAIQDTTPARTYTFVASVQTARGEHATPATLTVTTR